MVAAEVKIMESAEHTTGVPTPKLPKLGPHCFINQRETEIERETDREPERKRERAKRLG